MTYWDRWLQLELLVHLTDDWEKVGVSTPFLERLAAVHIGLCVNIDMNDVVHDMDRWSLHWKSVRHTHLDEEWGWWSGKNEWDAELFLFICPGNYSYVLVVAIELRDLILTNLCMCIDWFSWLSRLLLVHHGRILLILCHCWISLIVLCLSSIVGLYSHHHLLWRLLHELSLILLLRILLLSALWWVTLILLWKLAHWTRLLVIHFVI